MLGLRDSGLLAGDRKFSVPQQWALKDDRRRYNEMIGMQRG